MYLSAWWAVLIYIFTRRQIWSFFKAMFGAYVRFKCNYAALRKSSDNKQQHSLDSGGLLEIRCEYDCQHHHKGGYWTCEINTFYKNFERFNSLKNTCTDSRSNIFLRACFLRWWATLRHVHIQGRNTTKKTMTCAFWYRHSQPLGRSQGYTEYLLMFQVHI